MPSACALGIISGKIIFEFAFVALCGALQTHFHRKGRGGKQAVCPQRNCFRKKQALQMPFFITAIL